MELVSGRGYVYAIQYHIVWCVKNRRKILSQEIERSLRAILCKIANDKNFEIKELSMDLDYVHITVQCTPQHFIPDIIKVLKGVSARLLMKQYGAHLKDKLLDGHLWNSSYFIATASENTESQIRAYIESQKEK